MPAFSLAKTSWIIQQLSHRRTTRVEANGGDKDSADNPGEVHSTQQPEDPSECTEPISLQRRWFVVVSLVILKRLQQNHLSPRDGFVPCCWQFKYDCVISGDMVIYSVLKRVNRCFAVAASPCAHVFGVKWKKTSQGQSCLALLCFWSALRAIIDEWN